MLEEDAKVGVQLGGWEVGVGEGVEDVLGLLRLVQEVVTGSKVPGP